MLKIKDIDQTQAPLLDPVDDAYEDLAGQRDEDTNQPDSAMLENPEESA